MTTTNDLEGKVVISKEAFRNMMTHVLRFSNIALDMNVPAMGVCLGRMEPSSNTLTIVNAIPVKHGANVDENFTSEDFDTFNKIEQRFSSQNLVFVGWYRSHPGKGLFLSESDEINQLYFQKSKTSEAFCIVFDHTLIGKKGDFGFKIFRIRNFEKPNEYQALSHEIQIPDTLEFFKWCQKFAEDFHKKSPILIKEINELTEPARGDLQEIPIHEDEIAEEIKKDEYPQLSPIISGYKNGISGFQEKFSDVFKTQLGDWTKSVNQGIVDGAKRLSSSVNQMNETISKGFSKIQVWFDKSAESIISNISSSISEYIDERVQSQKDMANKTSNIKIEIVDFLKQSIEEQINSIFRKIEEKNSEISERVKGLFETSSKMENSINSSSEKLVLIKNGLTNFSDEINKYIESTNVAYMTSLSDEIQKLNLEVNQIKESYSNMDKIIQNLQKVAKEYKKI